MTDTVGFLGLGVMGQPIALRLAQAGTPLVVWNRTPDRCAPLAAAGAQIAATPADVFERCGTVLLMLANDRAADAVLGRGADGALGVPVAGRTVVAMGTTAPAWSAALGAAVEAAGGRYVEAPVSGSRVPAERGELVAMLAGAPEAVAAVEALLAPIYRQAFACGAVPGALRMKLAVNHYLITMAVGLCEAAHFARAHGLDMAQFQAVLDAGPMASSLSRMKLPKLVAREFSVQAAIADVRMNNALIADAARAAGLATPLLDACLQLYDDALAMGLGGQDMVGVVQAIERRGPVGSDLSESR